MRRNGLIVLGLASLLLAGPAFSTTMEVEQEKSEKDKDKKAAQSKPAAGDEKKASTQQPAPGNTPPPPPPGIRAPEDEASVNTFEDIYRCASTVQELTATTTAVPATEAKAASKTGKSDSVWREVQE